MQVEHLNLFVEQGYFWVVDLLYRAAEKSSPCRRHMDSLSFREFYLSRSVHHASFQDTMNIRLLVNYGNCADNNALELAQEAKWDLVMPIFVQDLEHSSGRCIHYCTTNVLLEACCNQPILKHLLFEVSKRKLAYHKLQAGQIKLYYKVCKINPFLLKHLNVISEYNQNELRKYLVKFEFLEEMAAFLKRFQLDEKDDKFALEAIHRLVDLSSVEGRKEFHEARFVLGRRIGDLIDLSQYTRFLLCAKTYGDYEERCKELNNKHGLLLSDFTLEDNLCIGAYLCSL